MISSRCQYSPRTYTPYINKNKREYSKINMFIASPYNLYIRKIFLN